MPSIDPKLANANLYKKWETEISDALKREKDYRLDGRKVVDIYEGRKADEVPFAILYSNTEVLVPAVYNSRPIPIVERRFKDADPLGKLVSEVSTRTLKYLIDNEARDYDSFDDLVAPAVLESLLVNRGLTRFKYKVDESTECVFGEAVRWDKFFHGYARTWKKVPWLGFEWDMSEGDLRENFKNIPLDFKGISDESFEQRGSGETKQELTGVRTYKVFEIWDKASKKVYFFSPVYALGPMREVEDPLGISNFFPVPKPLNFMRKVTTLVPTPLYTQYRQQAKELNEITLRLKALIKAIKVRGAYNSAIEGIEKMLEADDNTLVPVENMASMPENAGIDRALYIIPINDLVQAVQSLYQQREQVKQVIYEITGISDILRGASVASETATAQNIKNQWGTLRLKKMQKEVQRYCREALEIMLEIAARKFDLETFQKMTGLNIPTKAMQQQAQQQLQMQMQQAQQAAQAQMQQAQMQGQPPPQLPEPPQPPPEVIAMLKSPTWEDILGIFHDEVVLHYKVDIETNSTIDAEASQDKQDISELLNAISQFLNGVAPLVEQGILPMEVAKTMLLVVSRRFNFGSQLEDALEQMGKAPPKGPDPAEQAKTQAAQAQAQVAQAQAQADLARIQAETQQTQVETKGKHDLLLAETQLKMVEIEIKRQELDIQRAALGFKATQQSHQHGLRMQMMQAQMDQQSHQVGIQGQQQTLDQQAQDTAAEQQEQEPTNAAI